MRKTRLVILPGVRSITQIGCLLLFLSCPIIAFKGQEKRDIESICKFHELKNWWLPFDTGDDIEKSTMEKLAGFKQCLTDDFKRTMDETCGISNCIHNLKNYNIKQKLSNQEPIDILSDSRESRFISSNRRKIEDKGIRRAGDQNVLSNRQHLTTVKSRNVISSKQINNFSEITTFKNNVLNRYESQRRNSFSIRKELPVSDKRRLSTFAERRLTTPERRILDLPERQIIDSKNTLTDNRRISTDDLRRTNYLGTTYRRATAVSKRSVVSQPRYATLEKRTFREHEERADQQLTQVRTVAASERKNIDSHRAVFQENQIREDLRRMNGTNQDRRDTSLRSRSIVVAESIRTTTERSTMRAVRVHQDKRERKNAQREDRDRRADPQQFIATRIRTVVSPARKTIDSYPAVLQDNQVRNDDSQRRNSVATRERDISVRRRAVVSAERRQTNPERRAMEVVRAQREDRDRRADPQQLIATRIRTVVSPARKTVDSYPAVLQANQVRNDDLQRRNSLATRERDTSVRRRAIVSAERRQTHPERRAMEVFRAQREDRDRRADQQQFIATRIRTVVSPARKTIDSYPAVLQDNQVRNDDSQRRNSVATRERDISVRRRAAVSAERRQTNPERRAMEIVRGQREDRDRRADPQQLIATRIRTVVSPARKTIDSYPVVLQDNQVRNDDSQRRNSLATRERDISVRRRGVVSVERRQTNPERRAMEVVRAKREDRDRMPDPQQLIATRIRTVVSPARKTIDSYPAVLQDNQVRNDDSQRRNSVATRERDISVRRRAVVSAERRQTNPERRAMEIVRGQREDRDRRADPQQLIATRIRTVVSPARKTIDSYPAVLQDNQVRNDDSQRRNSLATRERDISVRRRGVVSVERRQTNPERRAMEVVRAKREDRDRMPDPQQLIATRIRTVVSPARKTIDSYPAVLQDNQVRNDDSQRRNSVATRERDISVRRRAVVSAERRQTNPERRAMEIVRGQRGDRDRRADPQQLIATRIRTVVSPARKTIDSYPAVLQDNQVRNDDSQRRNSVATRERDISVRRRGVVSAERRQTNPERRATEVVRAKREDRDRMPDPQQLIATRIRTVVSPARKTIDSYPAVLQDNQVRNDDSQRRNSVATRERDISVRRRAVVSAERRQTNPERRAMEIVRGQREDRDRRADPQQLIATRIRTVVSPARKTIDSYPAVLQDNQVRNDDSQRRNSVATRERDISVRRRGVVSVERRQTNPERRAMEVVRAKREDRDRMPDPQQLIATRIRTVVSPARKTIDSYSAVLQDNQVRNDDSQRRNSLATRERDTSVRRRAVVSVERRQTNPERRAMEVVRAQRDERDRRSVTQQFIATRIRTVVSPARKTIDSYPAVLQDNQVRNDDSQRRNSVATREKDISVRRRAVVSAERRQTNPERRAMEVVRAQREDRDRRADPQQLIATKIRTVVSPARKTVDSYPAVLQANQVRNDDLQRRNSLAARERDTSVRRRAVVSAERRQTNPERRAMEVVRAQRDERDRRSVTQQFIATRIRTVVSPARKTIDSYPAVLQDNQVRNDDSQRRNSLAIRERDTSVRRRAVVSAERRQTNPERRAMEVVRAQREDRDRRADPQQFIATRIRTVVSPARKTIDSYPAVLQDNQVRNDDSQRRNSLATRERDTSVRRRAVVSAERRQTNPERRAMEVVRAQRDERDRRSVTQQFIATRIRTVVSPARKTIDSYPAVLQDNQVRNDDSQRRNSLATRERDTSLRRRAVVSAERRQTNPERRAMEVVRAQREDRDLRADPQQLIATRIRTVVSPARKTIDSYPAVLQDNQVRNEDSQSRNSLATRERDTSVRRRAVVSAERKQTNPERRTMEVFRAQRDTRLTSVRRCSVVLAERRYVTSERSTRVKREESERRFARTSHHKLQRDYRSLLKYNYAKNEDVSVNTNMKSFVSSWINHIFSIINLAVTDGISIQYFNTESKEKSGIALLTRNLVDITTNCQQLLMSRLIPGVKNDETRRFSMQDFMIGSVLAVKVITSVRPKQEINPNLLSIF